MNPKDQTKPNQTMGHDDPGRTLIMMYFSTRYTVESYAARSVAARSTSHVIHVLLSTNKLKTSKLRLTRNCEKPTDGKAKTTLHYDFLIHAKLLVRAQ